VLTVGRHKDSNVQIDDPRVSVHHFDIIARKKYGMDAGDSELGSITYDCFLNDTSSNGTMVNGKVVGRGNSCHLHNGDEVCILSAAKVGFDQAVSWVFRNTTEILAEAPTRPAAEVAESKIVEHVTCPICCVVIYKCVALMPCFHNFCSACCSDCMAREFNCPVCRQEATSVIKNHAMDEVIRVLLEACPDQRRSEEECRAMDARDRLKLGADGNFVHVLEPPKAEVPAAPAARRAAVAAVATPARAERRRPNARNARGMQSCVLQ
jgi:hypothetical protein